MNLDQRGIVGQVSRIRAAAHEIIESELAAAGVHDVLTAHGAVFAALFSADGPVPIKAIVSHSGRSKSTITEMLDTLARRGYIVRSRSPRDGRVVTISLTERGVGLRPTFEHASNTVLEALYGDMPESERALLVSLLDRVERNICEDKDVGQARVRGAG